MSGEYSGKRCIVQIPTPIIQMKRKINKRPRLIQCWLLWYYGKCIHYNLIIFLFRCHQHSTFNIQPFWLLLITFWIWLAMEDLNPNTNYAKILHTSNETWLYCNTLTLEWMPCTAQCTVRFLSLAYKFNILPQYGSYEGKFRCQPKYEFHFRMTDTFCYICFMYITDFRIECEQI